MPHRCIVIIQEEDYPRFAKAAHLADRCILVSNGQWRVDKSRDTDVEGRSGPLPIPQDLCEVAFEAGTLQDDHEASVERCPSKCWDKLGNHLEGCYTQCRLAAGHEDHQDGAMSWRGGMPEQEVENNETPEDRVWLEILARSEEVSHLDAWAAKGYLVHAGFPLELIDRYLQHRKDGTMSDPSREIHEALTATVRTLREQIELSKQGEAQLRSAYEKTVQMLERAHMRIEELLKANGELHGRNEILQTEMTKFTADVVEGKKVPR